MTLVFTFMKGVLPRYAFESRQIPFDKNNIMKAQKKSIIKIKLREKISFCPLRGTE